MTDVRAPQGGALVTFGPGATPNLNAAEGGVLVAYNVPAENINATYGGVFAAFRQVADINVTQAHVLALVRGSISNPKLRVWTFDLDGHEFYVLRLGNNKTLVYDRTTEQWAWWASSGLASWRANIGTNWVQSGTVAQNYGSNVVVGDDTAGILWVLDPMQGYDDPTDASARENGETRPFTRIATGQTLTRGRVTIPCYQVYAVSDPGQPAYEGATVSLSYSDDGGNSFVDAGSIEAATGNYYQEFVWRSLGLVRSPGRLFRVTDDGAFAQLDELTLYDGTE